MQINKSHTFSYLVVFLFAFSSCEYLNLKDFTEDTEEVSRKKVAQVGDAILYQDELSGLVAKNSSAADSANLVGRYVNSWVRKQLLMSKAAEKISFDQAEIDRKLLDYKYALMVHEYKKKYVSERLDTIVTQEEVQEYYNQNKGNFELKQNIFRGYYVKITKDAPKLSRLRYLMNSKKESDFEELKSYSFRFADNYFLEDSVWINFDEVITRTPFTAVANKVQFLKQNDFAESQDDEFLYFLRIKEYKISDQMSPLEFVYEDIKQIILNKRKVKLANQLEDDVFNEAKEKNNYEIYF